MGARQLGARLTVGGGVLVMPLILTSRALAQDGSGFDGGSPPPSGGPPPAEVLAGSLARPSGGSGGLAFTGASTMLFILLALIFLVLGTLAWLAGRRGLAVAEGPEGIADLRPEAIEALDLMEATVTEVRAEMARLRGAVDDVADRVELRELQESISDLRGDLVGLRADLADLVASGDVSGAGHGLADLRASVEALRAEMAKGTGMPTLTPLVRELSALRDEVASLRRRVSLRAGASVPG